MLIPTYVAIVIAGLFITISLIRLYRTVKGKGSSYSYESWDSNNGGSSIESVGDDCSCDSNGDSGSGDCSD